MMVVQANPNTQPGGVQGALFRFWYHSEGTPSPVNNPPKNKPAKLSNKKMIVLNTINDFLLGYSTIIL